MGHIQACPIRPYTCFLAQKRRRSCFIILKKRGDQIIIITYNIIIIIIIIRNRYNNKDTFLAGRACSIYEGAPSGYDSKPDSGPLVAMQYCAPGARGRTRAFAAKYISISSRP